MRIFFDVRYKSLLRQGLRHSLSLSLRVTVLSRFVHRTFAVHVNLFVTSTTPWALLARVRISVWLFYWGMHYVQEPGWILAWAPPPNRQLEIMWLVNDQASLLDSEVLPKVLHAGETPRVHRAWSSSHSPGAHWSFIIRSLSGIWWRDRWEQS